MKENHYGGQAVLEGVMFRGKKWWVLAVRRDSGEIAVEKKQLNSLGDKFPILKKFPFRGILVLLESLILGMKALNISAQIAADEEEIELGRKEIIFTFALAMLFAIGLFVVFPTWVTKIFDTQLESSWMVSLAEGLFRIFIFILYIVLISFIPDITKVFQYHGAEHAAINAYESGEELTPEKVARYSPLHVRCGTSFILIVLVLVIVVFALVGKPTLIMRILSRIILIPVVAAISYELVKLSAKNQDLFLTKLMVAPGLWLQKITTRKPSVQQVEVSLAALKTLIEIEEGQENSPQAEGHSKIEEKKE